MAFKANILTLFPEMFPGPLQHSIAGKAEKAGIWEIKTYQIRDFAEDKHKTVDDKPFGGGTGMVIKPDVLSKALDHVISENPGTRLFYTSPRGAVFNQKKAIELSKENNLTFICGRYEGIDQRVIDEYGIEEISLGDFILSGGEIAALAVIDACLRLVPGVIIKPSAVSEESFGIGEDYSLLLEYPHYTRPSQFKGKQVPEVLISGNHAEVKKWRLEKAQEITEKRRPDMWEKYKTHKKV